MRYHKYSKSAIFQNETMICIHSLMETKAPLNLFEYLDPVEYLRDQFEQRKLKDSEFSYSKWATEMGFKSRAFVRMILMRQRNLTTDVALLFSEHFRFQKAENEYWLELVKLSQAKTLSQKEKSCENLTQLRSKFLLKSHDFKTLSTKDVYEYYSNYKIPRLRTLLAIPEIDRTKSNLAQLLQVSEKEVSDMLHVLLTLQLAKVSATNPEQYEATDSVISRPEILGHVALQSFHRKSLQEAIAAIDTAPEQRRFQSLMVPLTEEQFKKVNQTLVQSLQAILAETESTQDLGSPQKLYQINMNLIPVSMSFIRQPTSDVPRTSTDKNKKENL